MSTRAPIGKLAISKIPLCTNQGCKSICCNKELYNEFIYYFLFAHVNVLESLGTGSTFMELSSQNLADFSILMPSKEEQISIASFLITKDEEINNSISEIQSQIEDLKAYKSSVITEAVTGKIDLR